MTRRTNLLVGWVLAVALIALFVHLGQWQQARALEKQAMLAASAQVLSQRIPATTKRAFASARTGDYDWLVVSGTFAAEPPLLLDNQLHQGRPGVRVYRLFLPQDGGALLVDMGWLPLSGDRALPDVASAPAERLELRGLLAPPPSSGLALGEAMVRSGPVWLMMRIDPDALQTALDGYGALAPRVLRLDPAMALGYPRDLELLANTLPPDKHRGYALQWFGLALTVLATALVLTFRKRAKPARAKPSRSNPKGR